MSRIPLADAVALRPYARRTTAVMLAVAVVLVALVAAAVLVSRRPTVHALRLTKGATSAVVALDLSASISQETFTGIQTTLAALAQSRGRYGLVVFSDQAYEALPPGSAAENLRPLVRYFTLPQQTRPGFLPTFPRNPWQRSFSGGTKIAAGLELAHTLAVGQGAHRPGVVLISDLDDDPNDLPRLTAIGQAYRHDGVALTVVGLNATDRDQAVFRRIFGRHRFVLASDLAAASTRDVLSTRFPLALVFLALLAAVALTFGEWWSLRLDWASGSSS